MLETEIPVMDLTAEMGSMLGMFPDRGSPPAGALVQNSQQGYKPSQEGSLVYLSVGEVDLNEPVSRVEEAGGQVVLPKTSLGENGFCAWIIDTEDNKVGLHSDR